MTRQIVITYDDDWYNHKTSRKVIRTHLINIEDIAIEYAYKFLGAKEWMYITTLLDKCLYFFNSSNWYAIWLCPSRTYCVWHITCWGPSEDQA